MESTEMPSLGVMHSIIRYFSISQNLEIILYIVLNLMTQYISTIILVGVWYGGIICSHSSDYPSKSNFRLMRKAAISFWLLLINSQVL